MKTDTTYLHQVLTDPAYDYQRDIKPADAPNNISHVPSEGIDIPQLPEEVVVVIVIIFAVLAIAVCWLLWRRLSRDKAADEAADATIEPDTIENHEFDSEILLMLQQERYDDVVVLCYLRWLKKLDDSQIIKFDVSKTPDMFVNEVKKYCDATGSADPDLVKNTRTLTHHYLRIRYGHRKASAALANQLIRI